MGHGLRDLEIQAQAVGFRSINTRNPADRLYATYQLSNFQPTRVATCSPASSHFWAMFCVLRLRLHLWNVCSLRVDCSCIQIEHACPTPCWKLWSSLNATILFVCDVAQSNIWQVYAPELNTDELWWVIAWIKICIQSTEFSVICWKCFLVSVICNWLNFLAYYIFNWLMWGK